MNIFSSSNIATGRWREENYPKIALLSQSIAHDMSALVLRGHKTLAIWVWLPLVLPDPPSRAEKSLPQRMCYPFMVHELGCSGLGNTGIHKWKQNVFKITEKFQVTGTIIETKFEWPGGREG